MVTASHSAHSLPVRLTPFIGRQADLEKVLELIQNPSLRLVTILGPGGVGKTRLALELASILDDQFQHGAVFVPLAQLSTVEELLPALAGSLGVQLPPGGDLQQAVEEHLASQQVLLVLDNFEHLVREAALISDILSNAPQVKMLITSREKLNLEAETVYHLGGLQLPPLDSLEKIQDYDAANLFLQKARQVQPAFSLSNENQPAVIRICHLADGNALGILLAAVWIEHFSPAEIADEISRSLDFLSRQVRDAEPRHSSMGAVFDSSFSRLDENLQAVFRKLALFRGGFDLAAAQAVTGADLRTLIALVDKSLLVRDPHTGRYELHELLRQYAGERLKAASDHENTLAAYVDYYIDFVRQRERQLISNLQPRALDEIQADFDNIRQALANVIEHRDFQSARAVLPGLYAFCDMRSRFYEGEAMFRQAAEGLAPRVGEPAQGAWALALLSWFDMRMYIEFLESYDEITSQAHGCLEQSLLMEDAQGAAACLNLLGAIAQHRGDFRTAIQYCQEAMQVFPQLDGVYWVNMRIGLCYEADQQYSEAIKTFLACLQRGRQTGEEVKTGWSLQNIGDTLIFQGKLAEAQTYLNEALALFRHVGTPIGVLWSLNSLSRVAIGLGQTERARQLANDAAQLADQFHWPSWLKKTDALLRQLHPERRYASSVGAQPYSEPLSQRELEVLRLLKSELSGPDIAQKLVVSLNTVRYHSKNIYRKLGVSTRLEAIQRAKDLGL